METHSSILAWRNPGTEEPGRLPSMGSHRVGHDYANQNYNEVSPHTKLEWPSSKVLQTINAGKGVEKKELHYIFGGYINWCSHYGEQYGNFLKKNTKKLPYDSAIPILGIYPEKNHTLKIYIHPSFHYSTIYNSQDMEPT